jgi:chromosome partitioning protein
MGKILAVANTKGGAGKTTLACNLAWAITAFPRPPRVVLVDADTQRSATKWLDRSAELPFAHCGLSTARSLHTQLPRLQREYDLVVIDCPPVDRDVTLAAVCAADLGLVPMIASDVDADALEEMIPVLRQALAIKPIAVRLLVNGVSTDTQLEREWQDIAKAGRAELLKLLKLLGPGSDADVVQDYNVAVCKTFVRHRQLYRKMARDGISVLRASGAARDEFRSLAREVLHALA